MKRIKVFTSIIFFVLISGITYGQTDQIGNPTGNASSDISFYTLFSKPRTPLPNSFYSNSMWNYDWSRQNRFKPKELSLFGTANEIKTHGKVVVYDAAMRTLPRTSGSRHNEISIKANHISLSAGNRTLFIPIGYTGDKSVTFKNLSRKEKEEIANYIKKALNISGVTPSSVIIESAKNDFDIAIYKSKYTKEEAIIQSYKLRSRVKDQIKAEGIAEIESLIANNNLSQASSKLEALTSQVFDSGELDAISERIKGIHGVANINKYYNKQAQAFYIEEKGNLFSVYDGMNPKKEFSTFDKESFINYLKNNTAGADAIYLNLQAKSAERASAFLNSVSIKMKLASPELRVEAVPRNETTQQILFYGRAVKLLDGSNPISSNKHSHKYNFKLGNNVVTAEVGVNVKDHIPQRKSKKIIKSFFNFFNTGIGSNSTFFNLINLSRKQTNKKLNVTNEDYKTWLKNQSKDIDFVFIKIIETNKIIANE